MTDIQVSCGRDPQDLANVIAATLHGLVPTNPDDEVVAAGRMVRLVQERAERERSSWHDLPTVNFETLDEDLDWSEI
jgi:ribonuclease I